MTDVLLDLFDGVDATPLPLPASHPSLRAKQPVPSVHPALTRVVADSSHRAAWLRARSRGITATDVAKLATPASIRAAAAEKLYGTSFGGNPYTDHGRAREP
ncbi:hypothetical protein ACC691_37670, partial [Rhizobium johnstonii]|uniref:hypothetical protein n=1 Tax=Rhizobium johnstonii TaxID=3019933 RepID=UPI003F986293